MTSFKEEVKNKVKLYSNNEYLDGYIKNEYLTDDGDADVILRLSDKYDLFDYRTVGKQKEIRADIYDYIDDKTSMLDNDIKINLHIKGVNLTDKEEGMVRHIVKEHYAIELYKAHKEKRRITKIIFSLIAFGLLTLVLYAYLFFLKSSMFFIEVFGFLFSFALWKASENIIYDLSKINYQIESIAQKLLMEISINKDDETE